MFTGVFRGRKYEDLFVNKWYLCSTYDTGVFWERKWEGLFVEFLWAPKREYERPADLNPFLSGQAFAILVYVYWNNVLLMIMGLNWRYESRFDVITSNQSYWNYHGFLSAWGDLPAWEIRKYWKNSNFGRDIAQRPVSLPQIKLWQ